MVYDAEEDEFEVDGDITQVTVHPITWFGMLYPLNCLLIHALA
jgi:hypothetical protein